MKQLTSPDGQHNLTLPDHLLVQYQPLYPDYLVADAPDPEPEQETLPDPATIVTARRQFGTKMVTDFLADNLAAGVVLSASQSAAMAEAFRPVRELLETGSLGAALAYVRAWPTDAIFTPERKTRYREAIETYLANEGL